MTIQKKLIRCPAGIVSVGGRLKLQICYHLLSGPRRFGELQRLIPEASRQMLTIHLRELEQAGFLHRQVYAQMPPKVEYSLTEQGRKSEPMLRQFNVWGEQMGLAF
jgi:DNA-binding HxlR family transcriptional regulator